MLAFCIMLALTIYIGAYVLVDFIALCANLARGRSYTMKAFFILLFSILFAGTIYAWLLFNQIPTV